MEAYIISCNGLPITDKHCNMLNNIQLLHIKDNCIFSQISKYFILKSGYNIEDTYVLIDYSCSYYSNDLSINNSDTKLFISNDSEIIHPLMENIITLNDNDTIHFYNGKELIINKSKKGECFFIDYKTTDIEYYTSKYTSILKFYYYKNKPNIKKFYNNENMEFFNIQISSLQEDNFVFSDFPILFINNIYDQECIKSYMEKYNNLNNEERKVIINVKNESIKTHINNSDTNYIANELDFINLHGIRNFYNYKNLSLIFDNIEKKELIKNMFLNIKNKMNYNNNFSYKQPNIYFINKINLNREELLIKKIVENVLDKEYNSSIHDITIGINSDIYNPFQNDLIYTIIFIFEETNENEILILQDFEEPNLVSNHILFIKPLLLNAIGFQKHRMIENKIESKNFIEISVFNHITLNKYIQFLDNVEKKPFLYKNKSIIDDNNLDFTFKNNISKIISTTNKDVFTVENIKKIYKKFVYDSNTLHFFYKPNITFVNENILDKNVEFFGIKTTYINSYFKPIFRNIEKYCKNDIEIIDNKHYIFSQIIYIFNNIIINAIDSVFNNKYVFNVCNCTLISNKDELLKHFNSSYCDIQDNKNNSLIVYVDICIDTNTKYFGKLDIYTNYVNYGNILKNILRFTLEVENTSNDNKI